METDEQKTEREKREKYEDNYFANNVIPCKACKMRPCAETEHTINLNIVYCHTRNCELNYNKRKIESYIRFEDVVAKWNADNTIE